MSIYLAPPSSLSLSGLDTCCEFLSSESLSLLRSLFVASTLFLRGLLFWAVGTDFAFYSRMLAVMTMNVGYFLSVLAGAFVGELLVGRYSMHVEDHH